jgi:hypothetical protein
MTAEAQFPRSPGEAMSALTAIRMAIVLAMGCVTLSSLAAGEVFIDSHKPNAVEFPPQKARFVQLVIPAKSSTPEPCIDELEISPVAARWLPPPPAFAVTESTP